MDKLIVLFEVRGIKNFFSRNHINKIGKLNLMSFGISSGNKIIGESAVTVQEVLVSLSSDGTHISYFQSTYENEGNG